METNVICKQCGWEGNVKELDGIKCPTCKDGKQIEDVNPEHEYDNQYHDGFNWNKK